MIEAMREIGEWAVRKAGESFMDAGMNNLGLKICVRFVH